MSALMSERGLSLGKFGENIGVTRSAVWGYVSGVTTPQFSTILRMAEHFGKPLDFFVEECHDDGTGDGSDIGTGAARANVR